MGVLKKKYCELMNRPRENFLRNDVVEMIWVISSSDSEEDEVSSGRYSALPQDLTDYFSASDEDSDSDSDYEESSESDWGVGVERAVDTDPEEAGFDEATQHEAAELWNSDDNRSLDIALDPSKIEEIKSAMADFKLPITSIPEWALKIPEEKWKQQIMDKFLSPK